MSGCDEYEERGSSCCLMGVWHLRIPNFRKQSVMNRMVKRAEVKPAPTVLLRALKQSST